MPCSTVCAATVGAMTTATIIGGGYGLITIPYLAASRDRPEMQEKILNTWMIVTLTAATVGASLGILGILAIKTARFAYQKITGNQ